MALGSCWRRIFPSSIWICEREEFELGFALIVDEEFGFRIGVDIEEMTLK